VRISQFVGSFVRADLKLSELEPYRRAGSDAYDLIDLVPPASWARLAAWNAFMLQVYADCLVAASSNSRYVQVDVATFAHQLYSTSHAWVIETRKAEASDSYRFAFALPRNLPHWGVGSYAPNWLVGMRDALDTARTRAAHDLEHFTGDAQDREQLGVRLAEIDAQAEYVARLWTAKPTEAQCLTLGYYLVAALDDAFELGHLLAQPALIARI
jgi:hypothetical protein